MKKLSLSLLLLLAGLTIAPAIAAAQYPAPNSSQGTPSPNSGQGVPAPNAGQGQTVGSLTNPLGATTSICKLVKAILDIVILFGIPIATFFVLYAGMKLVLARGNPGALEKARMNLYYTIVGIAIFLGAWLLSQVIATTIKNLNIDTPGFNDC